MFTRLFPPSLTPRQPSPVPCPDPAKGRPSPWLRWAALPRLPSQCAVCRSWPTDPVCTACTARFAASGPQCTRCALMLPADLSGGLRAGPLVCGSCVRQPPPLDAAFAALPYAYPWSTLVPAYKFGGHHGWAPFFADLMLATPGVRAALAALTPADWVVPIPLSPQRLESRGFNQSWTLARAVVARSGTAAIADAGLLLRLKDTPPQSRLGRAARLANVRGAFAVEPLRHAELRGRTVWLVDDVMTSGASLFTAAQALRDAGAAGVSALVLARTPAD